MFRSKKLDLFLLFNCFLCIKNEKLKGMVLYMAKNNYVKMQTPSDVYERERYLDRIIGQNAIVNGNNVKVLTKEERKRYGKELSMIHSIMSCLHNGNPKALAKVEEKYAKYKKSINDKHYTRSVKRNGNEIDRYEKTTAYAYKFVEIYEALRKGNNFNSSNIMFGEDDVVVDSSVFETRNYPLSHPVKMNMGKTLGGKPLSSVLKRRI